jgi:hypothetical protein
MTIPALPSLALRVIVCRSGSGLHFQQVREDRAILTRRASEGSVITSEALPSLARRVGVAAVGGVACDDGALYQKIRLARSVDILAKLGARVR